MAYKIYQTILFLSFSSCLLFSQDNFTFDYNVVGNYDKERVLKIDVVKNSSLNYSFDKILPPHYSIPQINVTANGHLLLIHSLEGMVELYDTSTKRLMKRYFYRLPPYSEQTILYSGFNEGFYLLVSEQEHNIIFAFNNFGEEKLQKSLRQGLATGLESSINGDVFAVSIIQWNNNQIVANTDLFNNSSHVLMKAPILFESGNFNIDGSKFMGYSKSDLFLLNIDTKEIMWKKTYPTDKLIIAGVFWENTPTVVLASNPELKLNEWVYDKAQIIRIDFSGSEQILRAIESPVRKLKLEAENSNLNLIIDGKETSIDNN
jgi:hypothetical protein